MRTWTHLGALALALPALVACGCNGAGARNPDGGGSGSPGGELRASIGIDLGQVRAFASIAQEGSSPQSLRGRLAPMDNGLDGGTAPGPRLLALTLSGDVVEVTMVDGSPESQPAINAILPTSTWVLFAAPNFQTAVLQAGGDYAPTNCSMIASRRADGALFCAPLFVKSEHAKLDALATARANAAGDVVFAVATIGGGPGEPIDEDSFRLYRIDLGATGGPTAALAIPATLPPYLFEVNAAGDLYAVYPTSTMDPMMRSEVYPADGGPALTVQGAATHSVVTGKFGDADENTFYVMIGGGGGTGFEGTILVVTKDGASFAETTQVVTLASVGSYFGGLYRLADGVYVFSNTTKSFARVIADGAVVTNPTPVPLVGVDRVLGLDSTEALFPVGGRVVFIAASGSDYKFVRHDGVTQEDIPFEATLDVRRFSVSPSGAIDFFGVRTDTQEKVHGTIAAGSTEVTFTSAGVLDPDRVVVFQPVN